MNSRRFTFGGVSIAIAAGAVWLSSIGGCPAAQTPQQPADNSSDDSSGGSDNVSDEDEDDIPRPIDPPGGGGGGSTDGGTGGGGSTGGGGTGGGTGGGGNTGGGSTGSVFVSVTAPGNAIGVRPGTNVNVAFNLINVGGALSKAELVVAKDDDANGAPDGTPVFAQQLTVTENQNNVSFNTNQSGFLALLSNGFGRFVFGVRTTTINGTVAITYSSGTVTVDNAAPTTAWVSPQIDNLKNRDETITVQVQTSDNAPHTVTITLDDDQVLGNNSSEVQLVAPTTFPAGAGTRTFTVPLNGLSVIRNRNYFYQVQVQDAVAPATNILGRTPASVPVKIQITNRIVGSFNLSSLDNSNNGAVLQGFNFNDLAGSSIASVPDVDGDGNDELVIGSRFGKAYIIENNGVGFGEAYMIYGSSNRLRGIRRLNSVGQNIPGLIFPGIRTPKSDTSVPQNQSTRWTKGLSDIAVVPDMDGDDLPELVFSFPRVESISLAQSVPNIQHPELSPDLGGMGNLELDSFDYMNGVWIPNQAQFTRGGIVIASSHNSLITNRNVLNRKSDRIFDLHEAGQIFSGMARPTLVPYIRRVQPRPQIDNMRAAQLLACADCDFQQPDGWNEGVDNPAPQQDTPGECGSDGCGFNETAPADNPYTGNIHDGREKSLERWFVQWDVVFNNQGPGGFHSPFTVPPADPPLANPTLFPFGVTQAFPLSAYPNIWYPDFCGGNDPACEVTNEWIDWSSLTGSTFPCTSLQGNASWDVGGNPRQTPTDCYPNNPSGPFVVQPEDPCFQPPMELCPPPMVDVATTGASVWTGFYGPGSTGFVGTATGEVFETPIGARILGQKVDDEFGTAVGADGTWLYITAPRRTANDAPYDTDVPGLSGSRAAAGVVYQLRTNASTSPGTPTRTQLWLERGFREVPGENPGDPPVQVVLSWPNVDAEIPNRTDYTMPVPHQFIIESIGSLRGNPAIGVIDTAFGEEGQTDSCPPGYDPGVDQADADSCAAYNPYPVGTAGYFVDRVPQIVGPHADAQISYVRALGDVNDDGIRDFAVGSEFVKADVVAGTGATVGAVFLVYGRPTGVEGDYLLEQLALDVSDQNRLNGVLLRGESTGERLARVFDDAGDFNGDGISDVIVGNQGNNSDAGEAIVLLGSPSLISPAGGWNVADAVASGNAIRFFSSTGGDLAGANVAGAGDVDGDGLDDILIAAPGSEGSKGRVYLIYGFALASGEFDLAQVGTVNLPGAKLIGRNAGDFAGGTPTAGKIVTNTDPAGGQTQCFSRGVARLGDIDGDGRDDYAISSMLASPGGKTNAGEVFVLYGRGD